MRNRTMLAATLLVAVLVITGVASGKAGEGLVLKSFASGGGGPDAFGGFFDYPNKASCEVGRKVLVLLKRGGKDKEVGNGKSIAEGELGVWEVVLEGKAKKGKYYAKAPKKGSCTADRSDTFKVG